MATNVERLPIVRRGFHEAMSGEAIITATHLQASGNIPQVTDASALYVDDNMLETKDTFTGIQNIDIELGELKNSIENDLFFQITKENGLTKKESKILYNEFVAEIESKIGTKIEDEELKKMIVNTLVLVMKRVARTLQE